MTDPVEVPAVAKKTLGRVGVIVLVLAIVAVAGIAWVWLRGTGGAKGPSYPSTWDPRVAKIVSFVEKKRGLTFKHPVYVDFLTDAEFKRQVTSTGAGMSAKAKKELADSEAMLRSLGVISGKDDLLALSNSIQGSSIIGLYSYRDKRIRVRGAKVTPSIDITLAHELTHVLQDQYFDLTALIKPFDDSKTEDSQAVTGIIEGDAVRIQQAYRGTLSRAQLAEAAKGEAADQSRASKGEASVPQLLQVLDEAPYPLGEIAVQWAYARGGNDAVNALFKNPPGHDIALLDPWLIDSKTAPPTVAAPAMSPGATEINRGTFGQLELYLMLSKVMAPTQALAIAEGDANDLMVQYSHGGTSCVRSNFLGRDAAAAKAIDRGLTTWVASARTGAQISTQGSVVTLTSCDPGKAYKPGADQSNDALYLLTVRDQIMVGVEKDSGGIARTSVRSRLDNFSACYADAVVSLYSIAQLHQIDAGQLQLDRTRLQSLAKACASSNP